MLPTILTTPEVIVNDSLKLQHPGTQKGYSKVAPNCPLAVKVPG
jgi:hypothetical protein